MPIPANQINVIEIQTVGSVAAAGSSARQSVIVTHWRRTTISGTLNKNNIEAAYQLAIVTPIAALLNARWQQLYNTVRFVNDALDPPSQVSEALVGAIATDSMPTFNSSFLLMRTALRGRYYRGSKHLYPMSEADTTLGTSDVWNAGALTRLGAVAAALLAGFNDGLGNNWVPSVVSRSAPGAQYRTNPTTVVATDVTQVLVNKRVGRMRKREVKSVY